MKILQITPYYKPAVTYGGPVFCISKLCEILQQFSQEVTVITTSANGIGEVPHPTGVVLKIDGINTIFFKRWIKGNVFFAPGLLYYLIKNAKKYDLIHINSWWNLTAVCAVFICWLKGIKPVFSSHGMLSNFSFNRGQSKLKYWFHKIGGKCLLQQTILHATTKAEAQEAVAIIPNWSHFIAANILDLPKPTIAQSSTQHQAFRLVFFSRIHPKKGIDLLFRALAKVTFDWQLEIIGTGDDEYIQALKKQAQELKIVGQIDWLGWLTGDNKYYKLAESDLFVLTSHNENFANVVVEVLAMGVPVFISDQVGLKDYVIENKLGWVSSLDEAAIVNNLELVYQSTMKRETIRRIGPDRIRQDFDSTFLVKQYLLAYEKVIKNSI